MIGEFPPPLTPEPIRYTLEIHEHGYITVRCGDRYQDQLCSDEALWLIARILMTDGTVCLHTKAEHDAYLARWAGPASILEPWQKLICAPINSLTVSVCDVWRKTPPRDGCLSCRVCGNPSTVAHFQRWSFEQSPGLENFCDVCSPVVVL